MNAQPSFDPTPPPQQPSKTVRKPVRRSRVKKSAQAYAHRRQGAEVLVKLATYSALSVVGMLTLVRLVSYNYEQQSKLQQLDTAVKDAQTRTEQINAEFNRSFDPQSQTSLMQDNSYKVAPDRLPIVIVSPATAKTALTPVQK